MKDAYYFSHDSNAHNDPKMLSMICDYGMTGYGRFWVIVENLREQDSFKLKHDKSTWKALSMQMHCTCDEVKKYIEDCVYEYALLEMSEDLYFFSNSLNRRMDKYMCSRQKRSEAAYKRWNNAMDMQSTCNEDAKHEHCNAKESKVKESKINNTYTPEFEDFYTAYPRPEDKRRTFNNWNACLKSYTVDQLMAACSNYKTKMEHAGTEKQFIKSSANFLGKEKPFEDYINAEQPQQPASKYKDLTGYMSEVAK